MGFGRTSEVLVGWCLLWTKTMGGSDFPVMWLKQGHKPPIWEWFVSPIYDIYGDSGDDVLLFWPHYNVCLQVWNAGMSLSGLIKTTHLPTRWCPSSLAFSWFISTISLGVIRGLYRTSYWDYKPTYNWGGTTLYQTGIIFRGKPVLRSNHVHIDVQF